MIKHYKKKPVVIEAMQFTGTPESTREAIDFADTNFEISQWAGDDIDYYIETLEGDMEVKPYDYIIKGIKGEFYAVDKDIFEETYEEVK